MPTRRPRLWPTRRATRLGDMAHLLLVTGLKESWAVVTTEGESVQSRQLLHGTGGNVAFDVPITKLSQPNLVVNAVIVNDDKLITAQKSLKVPLVERTLIVMATSDKAKYLPGEKGSFDVLALDSNNKPVEADLSFGEVDEALYSVRPDESGNIVNFFYPRRQVYLDPETSFAFYFYGEAGFKSPLLARLNDGLFHPRLAQVKPGSDLVVPKVRKAFPGYRVLESQRAYRPGRTRSGRVQLSRRADHVADDDPRHDRRR